MKIYNVNVMFIMLYKHHLNSEFLTCRCCDSGECFFFYQDRLISPIVSLSLDRKTPFCGLFVSLFLCSGLFPSFVPKDNRTEQESVCSSVLCFVCLCRREINRIHTWFILLHLLFVSLDFNSNTYLQTFISSASEALFCFQEFWI